MIDLIRNYVIPASAALLPPGLNTPAATAMLLAIGLQETRFQSRIQSGNGPARGFWQFEPTGVAGVLYHPRVGALVRNALTALRYGPTAAIDLRLVLEHNDVAAAVFARALLATCRDPLPASQEADVGWRLYVSLWRPGQPRPQTWADHYATAWAPAPDTRNA